MGFRSLFIGEDGGIQWPAWFMEKWGKDVHFARGGRGTIASMSEAKMYGLWQGLPADVQRVLVETNADDYALVYLHECGGITRCHITQTQIVYMEPRFWLDVTELECGHDYCYGCSDPDSVRDELKKRRAARWPRKEQEQ